MAARISAPIQTSPGAHPASCTIGTGSFLGVKRLGRGVDHPPPSNNEVKERVELYLYSPSGASWPVLVWTLLSTISCLGCFINCVCDKCFAHSVYFYVSLWLLLYLQRSDGSWNKSNQIKSNQIAEAFHRRSIRVLFSHAGTWTALYHGLRRIARVWKKVLKQKWQQPAFTMKTLVLKGFYYQKIRVVYELLTYTAFTITKLNH